MNAKRGIIGTIVLIVIALIVLGYYNIDIKSIFNSPAVQSNLMYALQLVINTIKTVWKFLVENSSKITSTAFPQ